MTIFSKPVLRALAVLFCVLVLPFNTASAEPSNSEKLKLKAAVVTYIKEHTSDGRYSHVEAASTDLLRLTFVAMHPVIFERPDGTFALCADFKDDENEEVLIDYYLQELNGKYVVLSSIEGKRSVLMGIGQMFGL